MILSDKVEVKLNPSNMKYFKNYVGKSGDIIKVNVEDLNKGSQSIIKVKCDKCGVEKDMKYKLYLSYGYNDCEYYCRKCKTEINNIQKYGVKNVFQLEKTKEKIKETCLEKYGVDNVSKSKEIKEKKENTCKEKYGVKHHLQKNEILEKQKNTNLKKYGVDNVSKIDTVKEKKISSTLNNYNVKYFSQSNKWKNIIKEKCEKELKDKLELYGIINYKTNSDNTLLISCKDHKYRITKKLLQERIERYNTIPCTMCNPINSYSTSGKEIQLINFIKDNYNNEIIQNSRDIITPLELDIYLPNKNLAIEFNGLYWHSELYKDKNYHKNKYIKCKENNIQLLHIFEDDWNHKQEIVKSMILNKLGKTPNKIYARKCDIKEIKGNKLVRKFLNENHIQGFVGSSIKIGLFYNDELLSLMTFKQNKNSIYELNRFCNKKYYNVVGSASKLFNYFINNKVFNKIITFSNNSYSNGKIYETLKFKEDVILKPDYSYILDNRRYHKFNFRKSKLEKLGYDINKTEKETCLINNIYRIFDAGKVKWVYENIKT
ncbi:MAG: hypothetical protein M0R46_17005 [Candidatus Muirbacterium halophilum]|nr:hypothetical protein [Candidatus Muirbacterium halophilum]